MWMSFFVVCIMYYLHVQPFALKRMSKTVSNNIYEQSIFPPAALYAGYIPHKRLPNWITSPNLPYLLLPSNIFVHCTMYNVLLPSNIHICTLLAQCSITHPTNDNHLDPTSVHGFMLFTKKFPHKTLVNIFF